MLCSACARCNGGSFSVGSGAIGLELRLFALAFLPRSISRERVTFSQEQSVRVWREKRGRDARCVKGGAHWEARTATAHPTPFPPSACDCGSDDDGLGEKKPIGERL